MEQAKRILISISRKSSHWSTAWTCPDEVMAVALGLINEDHLISSDGYNDASKCLFVAKERWDVRIFIVFDVYNQGYSPENAHSPGSNDLPVTLVILSRREHVKAAPTPIMLKANKELEQLHDRTGLGSRPPFSVDHANGQHPIYHRPRTCIILDN
ncbi:hypothetical protein CDD80_2352 [Ophiocordyceps camponoti-rufipedis]|uniref:Uncharacterized protein n=1 Tax=Ophiocordyceps camponoti-rufipedis TaxID=2004952 RepID=A0A2C5Z6Y6_9HYPO|nr:hypothetical protein CDD80_2352 [Ophiocordyceps camponoti-rufipedis]